MPGYWDLQAQYGPSMERGVRIGSTIADAFMAGRQRRQQEQAAKDAELAAREAEAAQSREAGYRAGMMSQDPIQQESARAAYQRESPAGLTQFDLQLRKQREAEHNARLDALTKRERADLENVGQDLSNQKTQMEIEQGPKRPSVELDAIGKRVILENNYQPGTPDFQRRYSTLAAQAEREARQKQAAERAGAASDLTLKLRNEFQGLPVVKNMNTVAEAYEKINAIGNNPAGQMSLIFNYMKVLDPGSTVREGEYANAQNTTGVPGRISNMYNKALRGEFINPDQIADFQNEAQKIYGAQLGRYKMASGQYQRLSRQAGVSPGDVVLDVYADPGKAAPKSQEQIYNEALASGKSEDEAYDLAMGAQ